jgi:rubrerythrin
LDGRVYICGGHTDADENVADAHIYNPVDDSYTKVMDLPSGRRDHACAPLLDGRVYICGGYNDDGENMADAHIYNPATDTYTKVVDLPSARSDHACAPLLDGRVYSCGGCDDEYRADIYNHVTDTYTKVMDLPSGRYDHASAMLSDGKVYICGGYTEGYGAGRTAAYILRPIDKLPPIPIVGGSFRAKSAVLDAWLASAEPVLLSAQRGIDMSQREVRKVTDARLARSRDRVRNTQNQADGGRRRTLQKAQTEHDEAVVEATRTRDAVVEKANRQRDAAVATAARRREAAEEEADKAVEEALNEANAARERAETEANGMRDKALAEIPTANLLEMESSVRTVREEAQEHRQLAGILENQGASPAPPPARPESHHCVVCTDKDATHAVVPCGHKCMCLDCSGILVARGDPCPVCCGVLGSMLKVHE